MAHFQAGHVSHTSFKLIPSVPMTFCFPLFKIFQAAIYQTSETQQVLVSWCTSMDTISSKNRCLLFFVTVYILQISYTRDIYKGVLKQRGSCVYTIAISIDGGGYGDDDCLPLCKAVNGICGSAAVDLLLQIQSNVSDCSDSKSAVAVYNVGSSCSYLFSVPVRQDEQCPELCDIVTDICLCGRYTDGLKAISKQIKADERVKKELQAILHQQLSLLDDAQTEKHNLRKENEKLEKRAEDVNNQSTGYYDELLDLNITVKDFMADIEVLNDVIVRLNSLKDSFRSVSAEQKRKILQLWHENKICSEEFDYVTRSLYSKLHYIKEGAKDCYDIQQYSQRDHVLGMSSGVFTIRPERDYRFFDVFCDMDTDGGGWTVMQRREDGSVDFYRGWEEYKNGFGDLNGEFWLGNDKIHHLTNQGRRYELSVDLENFKGETRFAKYDSFTIGDENTKYSLILGPYHGNAGESTGILYGMTVASNLVAKTKTMTAAVLIVRLFVAVHGGSAAVDTQILTVNILVVFTTRRVKAYYGTTGEVGIIHLSIPR
ncbi:fibroleukin-like isoform X2 [Ptychodera flava]|uniref:fibroleukin-like isoform X2 n=1 Tax=Ptychodera flava TaxID=63121 RepID=UPI003969FBE2